MNAFTAAILSLSASLAFTTIGCVAGETDVAGDTDQAAAGTCVANFGLGHAYVEGRIVYSSTDSSTTRAAQNVEVILMTVSGSRIDSTLTNSEGYFLLEGRSGDVADLAVYHNDAFLENSEKRVVIRRGMCLKNNGDQPDYIDVGETRLVEKKAGTCESLVPTVRLQGRLVDSNGNGVSRLTIEVFRDGQFVEKQNVRDDVTPDNDFRGRFYFDLPPGHYDFEIHGNDFGNAAFASQRFERVLLGTFDDANRCYVVTQDTTHFPYQTITMLSK